MLLIFSVMCCFICTLPSSKSQVMGPFETDFRGFQTCPKPEIKNPLIYNAKYSKVGRKKFAVSFDIYAPRGVTNDIKMNCEISVKTTNGYKSNFYNSEYNLLEFGAKALPQYFNNPKLVKFPLAPGNYSVKDLEVDVLPKTAKFFFYNIYRVTVKLIRKEELIGCIEIIMDIHPKKNKN